MKDKDMKNNILITILAILSTIFAFKLFLWAIDIHFEQQDRMLCNSAKISGNREYLQKCQCFYAGQDIGCIHKGE